MERSISHEVCILHDSSTENLTPIVKEPCQESHLPTTESMTIMQLIKHTADEALVYQSLKKNPTQDTICFSLLLLKCEFFLPLAE